MFVCILFLLTISYHVSWCQYDLSNVFPGTRMSVNDDMFVSASNAFSNFAVIMHPFRNTSAGGPVRCNMRYNTTDRFVHSVSVAGIAKNSTNAEYFMFVFAAERMSTMTPYVCIGIMAKSTCINRVQCTDMSTPGNHLDYFLIGVDIGGTIAYGFTSLFVFKLNIYTNELLLYLDSDSVWPSAGFTPHAMDVADSWAVVAGYGYSDFVKKNYAALACYINLYVLTNATCVSLTSETTYLVPSNVIAYNELYELSVAIRGSKVLVGVHRLSSVVILQKLGLTLNVTRIYTLPYADASSVGRVVDWADDTTIAVLIQNPYETSWSKTQIFFYDEMHVTLTSPLFTFPNNQQILGSRLSRPSFARFSISVGGNMAILTDNADILIIPIASAGYASNWIDTTDRVFVFYFEPKLCIGGTYKNLSSLGPCQICPPRTRNPGTLLDPVLLCIPCLNDSSQTLCSLASLADIEYSSISSYSQAVAYPESADTTDIEDLLIKNVFQISSDPHCLLISPLLWTLVVSALCLTILIFMALVKLFGFKQCIKCRKKAKLIFKHTDIIGEGEMWAGGVATLAIVVLVSFSYWFSGSFIHGIQSSEITEPASFACDQSLINAKFSTGLELLAIPKSVDSQPIFDLLNRQTFYLTAELINTGFKCNSITTQENLVGAKYVPLSIDCSQAIPNATTSITFPLPKHQTTVQINMSGAFWIGGIRLCIRGKGQVNKSYTLRELNFCQFYSTFNEAIGRTTNIPIVFIKNVNMTQALDTADPIRYSGLWMPTFSTIALSDEAYYLEFGNYLRYTSALTIIQIVIDERPFIIKNIQQPIVRTAELIFHGLLFTSLCIELFAFSFLIIKLLLVPLLRWFLVLWKKLCPRCSRSDHSDASTGTSIRSNNLDKKIGSIYKVDTNHTIAADIDFPVSAEDQNKPLTPDIELDSLQTVNRL